MNFKVYGPDDADRDFSIGFIVLILFLVLCMLFSSLMGCASREVSSTDNHHRVPKVECTEVKYQGHLHQLCCERQACAFTN